MITEEVVIDNNMIAEEEVIITNRVLVEEISTRNQEKPSMLKTKVISPNLVDILFFVDKNKY